MPKRKTELMAGRRGRTPNWKGSPIGRTPPHTTGKFRKSPQKRISTTSRPKNIIGPLKKGTLSKYGYHDVAHKNKGTRHTALAQAVNDLGWLAVFRKLNAIWVLNRRKNYSLSQIFLRDRDWVRRTHEMSFMFV